MENPGSAQADAVTANVPAASTASRAAKLGVKTLKPNQLTNYLR
jgi:hypothetical protein